MPYVNIEERREFSRRYYIKNKEKIRSYVKRWKEEHPEQVKLLKQKKFQECYNNPEWSRNFRIYSREYRIRIKLEVLTYYSNGNKPFCKHCGYSDIRALAIDHINDDGAQQRKLIGSGGYAIYLFLKKNNFPDGHQVLCFNCNTIKHINKLEKEFLERHK